MRLSACRSSVTTAAKPCSHSQEPLFAGEELELIQPGQAPYVFRAENVSDDEGHEARAVQRAADARALCVPVQGERVGDFAEGQGTARVKQTVRVRRQEFSCFISGGAQSAPFFFIRCRPLGRRTLCAPAEKRSSLSAPIFSLLL